MAIKKKDSFCLSKGLTETSLGLFWWDKVSLSHPNFQFQIDCAKHRCVDESEGRLWAESKGFLYFETSAQTGEGINEMFQVT